MTAESVALMAAAGGFGLLSGANDGGAILSLGVRAARIRPALAFGILILCVGVMPLLVGTAVATTLARRLVEFETGGGEAALLTGVIAALVVVGGLSVAGLPTSLTLALVGGVVGSGIGFRLAVDWSVVSLVLLIALVAPLAAAGLGWLTTSIAIAVRPSSWVVPALGVVSRVGYTAQSAAYGANDGQKVLALLAVAAGVPTTDAIPARPELLIAVAVLFAAGLLVGGGRVLRTLAIGVLPPNALTTTAAELSSATAVITSTALGAPVSMTQSITGAMIGGGVGVSGRRRVRWLLAGRIAASWVFTLPAAMALASIAGAAVGVVEP